MNIFEKYEESKEFLQQLIEDYSDIFVSETSNLTLDNNNIIYNVNKEFDKFDIHEDTIKVSIPQINHFYLSATLFINDMQARLSNSLRCTYNIYKPDDSCYSAFSSERIETVHKKSYDKIIEVYRRNLYNSKSDELPFYSEVSLTVKLNRLRDDFEAALIEEIASQ